MNEKDIQNLLNETYDQGKEDTLRGMIKDFYNRKNTSNVILVWIFALLCIAGAVICGIMFSKASETKIMILYATLFLVCAHWVDLMKIFAWQMIHRNSLKREIKRLEIRIAELNETIKGQ